MLLINKYNNLKMLSVVQVCVVLPSAKHGKYKSQLALKSLSVKTY